MVPGLVAALVLAAASPAVAQQPLALVDQTLGRFDPDTPSPVGPTVALAEAHTAPVLSADGAGFAVGVPAPGARACRGAAV